MRRFSVSCRLAAQAITAAQVLKRAQQHGSLGLAATQVERPSRHGAVTATAGPSGQRGLFAAAGEKAISAQLNYGQKYPEGDQARQDLAEGEKCYCRSADLRRK